MKRRTLLAEFIAEDIHKVGDARQLLADSVVQIVPDATLLTAADFENFAFETTALGNVARDALDLDVSPVLSDEAGTDFQFHAKSDGVDEVPFRRGRLSAVNHLFEPLSRGDLLVFRHQLDEILRDDVLTVALKQTLAGLVDGRDLPGQVVGENHVVGVLEQIHVAFL